MDGNHFSLQPQQHSVSIAKFFKSSRWIGAPVSALPYRRNVKKPTPPQVETVNCAYSGRMIGIGCSLKTPLLLRINETTIPVQTFSISVVETLYAMSITPNDVIDPCSIWFIHHHLSLYRYVWPRLAIVFSPSANIKAKVTNQSEGTRLKND